MRIQANLQALAAYGLNIDDLRTTIANANSDAPKGSFDGTARSYSIDANDQIVERRPIQQHHRRLSQQRPGAPVRRRHGDAERREQQARQLDELDAGHPAQRAAPARRQRDRGGQSDPQSAAGHPQLRCPPMSTSPCSPTAPTPSALRSTTSQFELSLAVALVVLVIFLFLRSMPATIIPSLSVPLSLIGTFAVMYLCGFSLNNLSLMALTIASGFVVDDAIVMIENISRYIEKGEKPLAAALKGSGEIGFTIVSLTVSLIAVLIPLLFMREVVGRLFREFAITLSISILISAVVSLTLVPMLCAKMLRTHEQTSARAARARIARRAEQAFQTADRAATTGCSRWVLDHQPLVLWVATGTVVLTVLLYVVIPKGFFPLQDTGILQGTTEAAPAISFERDDRSASRHWPTSSAATRMSTSLSSFVGIDGTNTTLNNGRLPDQPETQGSSAATASQQTMARLSDAARQVSGITLYLQPVQDLTIDSTVGPRGLSVHPGGGQQRRRCGPGCRSCSSAWQRAPQLANVSTNFTDSGLTVQIDIDRDTAARFGVTAATIDNALYDAFGQRIISTIYTQSNEYRVIMEGDPKLQSLDRLAQRHLRAFRHLGQQRPGAARLDRAHFGAERRRSRSITSGNFRQRMFSFDVAPGASLENAVDAIRAAEQRYRPADQHLHDLRRRGAGVPVLVAQRGAADPGRDRDGLHRARRAVRELHPPADDSLDAAVRRHRRTAGA